MAEQSQEFRSQGPFCLNSTTSSVGVQPTDSSVPFVLPPIGSFFEAGLLSFQRPVAEAPSVHRLQAPAQLQSTPPISQPLPLLQPTASTAVPETTPPTTDLNGSDEELSIERKTLNGQPRYMCPFCRCSRTVITSLRQHIRKSHNNLLGSLKFSCQFCSHRFSNELALSSHLRRSVGCRRKLQEEPSSSSGQSITQPRRRRKRRQQTECWGCELCTMTFSSKISRDNHMAKFHQSDEASPFYCVRCSSRFSTLTHLHLHEATAECAQQLMPQTPSD